jgi:hypothetical protein
LILGAPRTFASVQAFGKDPGAREDGTQDRAAACSRPIVRD